MGLRFCDDDVVLANVERLGDRTNCSISKQRAAHTAYNETSYLDSVNRPQYLHVPSQLDSRIIQRLTRPRPRICHPLCTDIVPSPPDREQAPEQCAPSDAEARVDCQVNAKPRDPLNLPAIYTYRRLPADPVARVRHAENEKPECVFPNSQNGPRTKTDL